MDTHTHTHTQANTHTYFLNKSDFKKPIASAHQPLRLAQTHTSLGGALGAILDRVVCTTNYHHVWNAMSCLHTTVQPYYFVTTMYRFQLHTTTLPISCSQNSCFPKTATQAPSYSIHCDYQFHHSIDRANTISICDYNMIIPQLALN